MMLLPLLSLSYQIHYYNFLHRCHVCCCQRLLTLNCSLVDVLLHIQTKVKDVWAVMVTSYEADAFTFMNKGRVNVP